MLTGHDRIHMQKSDLTRETWQGPFQTPMHAHWQGHSSPVSWSTDQEKKTRVFFKINVWKWMNQGSSNTLFFQMRWKGKENQEHLICHGDIPLRKI